MPRISYFHGISIYMYFDDHGPPHFHALTAEHHGTFSMDGTPLAGDLPPRSRRLVRRWASAHTADLARCWDRVSRKQDPGTIAPLP